MKIPTLAVPFLAVLLALAPIGVALAPVGVAQANSYQDDAIQALQGSQVYVESSVSLPNETEVGQALQGADIAVAVLPSFAVNSLTPQSFARELLSGTEYGTLVVILDGNQQPLSVAYRTAPSEESAKAVYAILSENDNDLSQALVPIIEQLKSGASAPSPDESNGSTSDSSAGGFVGGFLLVMGLALIACIIYALTIGRRKFRESHQGNSEAPLGKIADVVPSKLHVLIRQLDDLASKHLQLEHGSLTPDLKIIVRNVQELFARLSKKGTNGQRGIAEVEYVDKLTKLNEALGENYYLDIVKHPELWDDSQKRLDSVSEAVQAVKSQLIENIKQVNASKDLEFQVVLDSLVGSANATTVKDIYKPNLKRENK